MRDLNYELTQLDYHNHDGSWATRINRQRTLLLIANQLAELGYKNLHAADLKGRHATALVRRWRAEGLAAGTVKNRLSALRWWAKKVGRPGVLPPDNATYGVPARQYIATEATAQELDAATLAALRDPYVRLSLELQRAFGLRRSEAINIIPAQADHGDRLLLQASWTMGGRSREIPLRTPAQRDVLERAKALAGGGALLPPRGRIASKCGATNAIPPPPGWASCTACGTPMPRSGIRNSPAGGPYSREAASHAVDAAATCPGFRGAAGH